MDDTLATYLQDHLAGSKVAVELLEALQDQYANEPTGQFVTELLAEIQEDRTVLKQLVKRLGEEPSPLKEATGWLGEKMSRFKFKRRVGSDFGTFEALEFLSLGITGKRALWRMLAEIAPMDARVQGPDYEQLTSRAQAQYDRVEERRLEIGRMVLPPAVTE